MVWAAMVQRVLKVVMKGEVSIYLIPSRLPTRRPRSRIQQILLCAAFIHPKLRRFWNCSNCVVGNLVQELSSVLSLKARSLLIRSDCVHWQIADSQVKLQPSSIDSLCAKIFQVTIQQNKALALGD